MKYKLKQMWRNIKIYASLPHFWILGTILVLSIITCAISVACMKLNPFLSSVFANIFAGLITGIVISLISTIKSITLYRTECIIEWLDSLHKDILKYISMYKKMVFRSQKDFDSDETLYNHIYGTLCCGNDINVAISQGKFDYSLPFDPYKYMKNKFEYDAINCSKNNDKLREQIMLLDIKNVTNNELRNLFEDMDRQLKILNGKILKHITNLKTRKKAINISFM
ncbi:MAG: hypothetical protein HDR02_05325 [Lachnospiraceae bacterium]|nr:hypothetical protein [Lachnospiraceae bacterium]